MNCKQNESEGLLKQALEKEIELITAIRDTSQLPELVTGENSSDSVLRLAALVKQFKEVRQASERQGTLGKSGDASTEIAQLRERKRSALADAIACIRRIEERVVNAKNEVLAELSAVNRSQRGHNTYVQQ